MAGRLAALQAELPPGCRLLAVSKGQPSGRIREAVAAGQLSFGESRLQEAVLKQAELADLAPLDWHFIGRLQANKARGVVRHFGTIHSLDSLELARRLARIAAEEQRQPAVFFQVKFRPDPAKTGFEPAELCQHWPELAGLAPLQPLDLMTLAPPRPGRGRAPGSVWRVRRPGDAAGPAGALDGHEWRLARGGCGRQHLGSHW